MIPGIFSYHRPASVTDAVGLLADLGDEALALAGGHSLIPMMKLRLAKPGHLIDLGGISDLRGIRPDGSDIVIGAMTTQHELIGSALLTVKLPILRETSLLIADPQVRYVGTLGGNVANGDPGNDMPSARAITSPARPASAVLRLGSSTKAPISLRSSRAKSSPPFAFRYRPPGTATLTKSSSARSAIMRLPPPPSC
jgi:xanthine dehydrogenase iron-sulfur cluster and FAD-binding subunit A